MATHGKRSTNPASFKPPPAVPDAEAERRLRPVIEALFARNSKQATKYVNQALQKRPGWPAARALRACILLQTYKFAQASEQIASLRADLDAGRVPINEDAAAKLHMYYQEIRRDDLSAQVYELAWQHAPNEVRLADTAYCLYIRGSAFKSAQKLATRLHRLLSASTQRYAFWATAALWLDVTYHARLNPQSHDAPDARVLQLCCAIMSKALSASQTRPSAEIVRFATRVYKQASSFSPAIQLLSHPQLVMDQAEILHLRADLAFSSTKDCTDYRALLTEHSPNDWDYWLRYFDSAKASAPDSYLQQSSQLVDLVLETCTHGKEPLRGPYLARLELAYLDNDLPALAEHVADYFRDFGDKAVVSRDLRPWLMLVGEKQLQQPALDRIEAVALECGFPFHLHSCWLQLWFNRLTLTPEELVQRHVSLLVDDIEPTDRQQGDDYISLAAHTILPYLDSSNRLDNTVAVLKTICMVEAALTTSPCNHDFKLLLIRLYESVGGIDRMAELWHSLDVKHVQLSTLGHIVLQPFFEMGHHSVLELVLESIDSLWREIDREIPECTTSAFNDGSINAAVDFVLFKLRLEQSAVFADAMVLDCERTLVHAKGDRDGVSDALSVLSNQPRFTVRELTGEKRIVASEDTVCYKFWDSLPYDADSRLESLREETSQQGTTCEPKRVKMLARKLASLKTIVHLAKENHGEDDSDAFDPPEEIPASLLVSEEGEEGSLVWLRLHVAVHLLEVKGILDELCTPTGSTKANGNVMATIAERTKNIVKRGKELAACVVDEVRLEIDGGKKGSGGNGWGFPKLLRDCGRVTYELLMVIVVGVSSFSPVLAKGIRQLKKSGSKGGGGHGTEHFEQCRSVLARYKDAVLSAASLINEWVVDGAGDRLLWGANVFEDEGMKDLDKLVGEEVAPTGLGSEEEGDGIVSREEFCRAIVDSVRSSHSVSCKTLLETLVELSQRLEVDELRVDIVD